MADDRDEKGVQRRNRRQQGAHEFALALDTASRSEACCPSAELVVRPRVRFLDGPAGGALAARQGRALLRAVAELAKLDEEGG